MFPIGKRIFELRKLSRLSQKDLASEIGINQASVSQIESVETNCLFSTLEKICEVLHISLSDFFKNEITEMVNPPIENEIRKILTNSNISIQELKKALKIIIVLRDNK